MNKLFYPAIFHVAEEALGLAIASRKQEIPAQCYQREGLLT